MILAQLINFFLFSLLSIIFFTIPGLLILGKTELDFNNIEKLTLSTTVGLLIFTLIYYLLILTHIDFLIIPLVIVTTVKFMASYHRIKIVPFKKPSKQMVLLVAILLVGIVGQLAIISPSGLKIDGNILFWSSHAHDGTWHLALINEINKGWPLQNPSFAGEKLVNYHFFSDIAPAFFTKYLRFSGVDLYFRYFPFLYSLLLGTSAFVLGRKMGKSLSSGIWATIFVYFVGSFGYFATLIQKRGIGGESIFWATQIQSSIGNPPQIMSDILVITFLYLFLIYLENENKIIFILCTILAGSLAVFKVYAGIVVILGLGLVALLRLVKERKLDLFTMFLSSLFLTFIFYFPNSSGSASFLIFQPWWYIRTMVVESSRLNWIDLELRRQHYLSKGTWHAYLRVIQIEATAFLIFLFGNLGVRFIGIFELIKMTKSIFTNYFNLIFLSITISSLALPLIFLQKGVASNTSQFLQYFILFFGFLAAISISKPLAKIKPNLVYLLLFVIIIILAVPTQVSLLHEFYSRSAYAKISSNELAALDYIKNSSDKNSIILTSPYDRYRAVNEVIPEIWQWFDTSYVAAFSERRVYMADFEQLDIMGYKFEDRKNIQKEIFSQENPQEIKDLAFKNNISLIYFPITVRPKANLEKAGFQRIFSNREVEVWKVN